jgi:hypothetical protein
VVALCSFAAAHDVADAVTGSFVAESVPRAPAPARIENGPSGVV